MKSAIHLTLFLSICFSSVKGQNLFDEKFGPYKTYSFSVEFKTIQLKYPIEKLLKDICENTDNMILEKLRGDIRIQVVVDTLGIPCVLSTHNNLNLKTVKTNFVSTINDKTKWVSPPKENKNPNPAHKTETAQVAAIIALYFTNENIIIKRFGLDMRQKSWVELETYTQHR